MLIQREQVEADEKKRKEQEKVRKQRMALLAEAGIKEGEEEEEGNKGKEGENVEQNKQKEAEKEKDVAEEDKLKKPKSYSYYDGGLEDSESDESVISGDELLEGIDVEMMTDSMLMTDLFTIKPLNISSSEIYNARLKIILYQI